MDWFKSKLFLIYVWKNSNNFGRYELVKTEDLPYLPGSKFSPKLIHDVAQNILSFLKSNATTAGHTYWLFKGNN
jgi:hypothetical protein